MSAPWAPSSFSAVWVAGTLAVGGHAAIGLSVWHGLQRDDARVLRPVIATALQAHSPRNSHRWVQAPRPAAQTPQAESTSDMPPVSSPQDGLPAAVQAEATTAVESDATANAEADPTRFYPRPELDIGPAPLAEVLIPFPVSSDDDGHRSGRFRLFIDEQGVVQDVLALDAESTLSPAMVVAARTAFLGTRFEPGQKQGLVVRSRIDVEVSFDTQRLPAVASAAP